jgi:hypothetical protein
VFVGHYAPAYAIKRRVPEAPLWALFLGVQAVDVLFFILVPLGIERMAMRPGMPGPLAMELQYLPYTHSLAAALLYAALCVAAGRLAGRPRLGVAIGIAVASHWFADLLVHTPDLHLGFGPSPRLGLGLWRNSLLSNALEVGLVVGAYAILRPALAGTRRRWGDAGVVLLVAVQLLNAFVLPPPESTAQLAVTAEVAYVLLALLVVPVDRTAP